MTWDFPKLKVLRAYYYTSSLCSSFFISIEFYKLACFGNCWPKRHLVRQTISYSSVYSSARVVVLGFSVIFLKALKTYFFKQLVIVSDGIPEEHTILGQSYSSFGCFICEISVCIFILWALFTGLKGTVSGTSEHQSGVATFESEFDDRFNFFFSAQFCCVVTTVVLAADFEVK